MYVVEECSPLILGNNVWGLERETAVLFEVQTCSRMRVQLKNGLFQPVYQLEFAKSDAGVNNISTLATGETTNEVSQFIQDCATTRQFWVTWRHDVISGGVGLNPGTKVVMRLSDLRGSSDKAVVMATMTTLPYDDTVNFKIFRRKFHQCHEKHMSKYTVNTRLNTSIVCSSSKLSYLTY